MIFRTPKRSLPFTQISNDLINNPNLSSKAKWILIYLLSKPADWLVYENDIVKHTADGRFAIRSGVKELIDQGYLKREILRNPDGTFSGYLYDVSETPVFTTNVSIVRFPDIGQPNTTNTKVNNMYEEQKFQRGERGNMDDFTGT